LHEHGEPGLSWINSCRAACGHYFITLGSAGSGG